MVKYVYEVVMLDSCYELRCYSVFVARVREHMAENNNLSQAIKSAIRYCRDNKLLEEYFREHESEVLDMVTFCFKMCVIPL